MKFNLFTYIKSPIFLIITCIYLFGIISLKIYFFDKFNDNIMIEQSLFLEGQALITHTISISILMYISFLSIPTFLYTIFIGITYYHHVYEIDSAFIFLRISRNRKLLYYYLEILIIYLSLFVFLSAYQLFASSLFFELNIDWSILITNLINTLIFNLLIIIIIVNLQLISTDWGASGVSLLLFILFTYGNYLYQVIINENYSLYNKYLPTLMNALYFNNLIYGLIYLLIIGCLILLSLFINKRIDIDKGVIR